MIAISFTCDTEKLNLASCYFSHFLSHKLFHTSFRMDYVTINITINILVSLQLQTNTSHRFVCIKYYEINFFKNTFLIMIWEYHET